VTQAKRSTWPLASTHPGYRQNDRCASLSTLPELTHNDATPAKIAALGDAEQLSPEHVRSHHLAKSTIKELLDQPGRRASTELVELARRAGATP
jgi:hypothetical protein